jgi:hypothetical protein
MSKKQEAPKKKPKNGGLEKLWDRVISIDHKKATKMIIGGMIIAIIFGTAALISHSIASNSYDWENLQYYRNDLGYWRGDYGYQEYLERNREIDAKAEWLRFQEAIFVNIARVGVNIGLLGVMVGFIGYSADKELDEKKRRLSFILAALIIVVVMFTALSTGVTISIG